ncbi:hypothetical protein KY360_02710 [Candidatus Woesearchaeota archaeon]|nr:hypothetical protein [Candidatus Woesearchaeota archaeon]
MKDKTKKISEIIKLVLCIILLLVSSLNFFIIPDGKELSSITEITGGASSSGTVGFFLLRVADTSNNYRRRVFYEDGSVINLTVIGEGIIENLKANFSCMDSNYADGAETVTNTAGNNYSISYTISQSNTVTNVNNSEDSTCPVGEECHRTCTIPVTSGRRLNGTVQLAFYEGKAALNYAWYVGYVTRAANCAAGVDNSNYFLENNTCSSVFYNPADSSYYYGAKDVDFSIKKKNTPDVVETHCANNADDDGDGKIDCEDSDCASIVYGEYYIVGGSNTNKQGTPAWTCNKTAAGWRDDPPYDPGDLDGSLQCIDGGTCDASCAPNLCTGTASNTAVTYTYKIQPEALFSMRLYQTSQITGYTAYFKVWQFNTSLWQENPGDFWILNYSATTGLSGKTTSANSIIAQSGPNPPSDPTPYTQSTLDNVLKAMMNTTNNFYGMYGLVLNRIFNGSAYDFKFNINISDDGVRDEHDISCADSYDNDLDYTTDCIDIDCDAYIGSTSANPDGTYPLCAYQNESKYAATNNSCTDGFDNDDDGDTDCHYNAGTWDTDCNNTYILNSSWLSYNVGGINGTCELGVETICNDLFDNDRDRAFDCNTTAFFTGGVIQYLSNPTNPRSTYSGGGTYPHGEYDCFNDSNCPINESGITCIDGKDNDLDFYSGLPGAGADCRMVEYDIDCNSSVLPAGTCQLIFETSCSDGFDNDQDGELDCNTTSTGASTTNPNYQYGAGGSNIAHGEYDCQSTCNVTNYWENDGANCSDNKDNDLDYYTITGWTGTQYSATNNQYGGGMDCRYNYDGNHYPDADCDGVDMGPGKCELGHEINCTDGYDNDLDNAYNPGGNRTSASGGYDCDDYDCANDSACPTTETASLCTDGVDNDLDRYVYNITDYLLDSNRVENLSGGIDCIYYAYGLTPNQFWPYAIAYDSYRYDQDCNDTAIGPSGQNCELIIERNCTDVFDNDQDYYISQMQNPGWTNASYQYHFGANTYLQDGDCNDYSCYNNSACPGRENYTCSPTGCNSTQNWCLDSIDNDLDNYLSDGINLSTAAGAGIDCAWNNYDSDCNNTYINDSGNIGLCTIRWEYNCSDGVDNDQDLGTYYVGESGSAHAGANTGEDCDDYNCYAVQESGLYVCTDDGSGLSIVEQTCNDTLDNDLDAYTWNGTEYETNDASGTDCGDPDCNGLLGPGDILCALFEEMYFDPFDDTLCGDYNSSGTTAYSMDNDGDNLANCYDTGCYHQGLCRVCPPEENVTLDSCMDGLNNEYEYQDEYISKTNYDPNEINASLNDGVYDCRDSDCDGIVGVWSTSQGICNSASAGTGYRTTESACTDSYDNDFDNSVDCEDSDCSSGASCLAPYTNSLAACTLKCSDAAAVSYIGGEPPDYSVNTNWGGGTPDLTYTEYHWRGKNLTFTFTDSATNVNGKTIQIYLGSASATYVPLDYEMNASNSGIYGTDSGNFNVQYSAQSGYHYQAVLIEYSGAYPNQILNLTFWITVPDNDTIVQNSSFSYYVSTSIGGVEQNADVTQYILETEPPQAPVFVKTTPADDDYTTSRLRMIKTDNTVTRLSASDTVYVRVNATDSGTWNSGVELCQFNDGTGWVNETSAYDCRYALTLSDGLNTIYARAVDGVGNIGPNTSLTIDVRTLPKQTTGFFCIDTNCSTSYPTKDYYVPTETLNVAVNFTSTYGFTANASGCVVYAEKNSPGSRISLGSVPLASTGMCNGTVSLSGLSEGYYTVEVELRDDNDTRTVSGELPWSNGNSKENIWVCDYTQTYNGYTCKDACEREEANRPSKVILKSPESGNTTTELRPTFTWYNATYNGSTTAKYEIEIDDSPIFTSLDYSRGNLSEGSNNETSHTLISDLELDKTYFWRVRAYHSIISGEWSDVWNFTLSSYIAINLTRDVVDFGVVIPGFSESTEDDSPLPLLLENVGNLIVNISINATDLFETVPNPNESYQFAIGVNESGSFTSATTTLTPMPSNSTPAIYNLNWEDASDTAEIDLNATVPLLEPSGQKNSTILVRTT